MADLPAPTRGARDAAAPSPGRRAATTPWVPSGNLPVEPNSLVGREWEAAEVGRLLTRYRLVTLTGVGGVGKSRLACRVAGQVQRRFRGGAWVVDVGGASALDGPDAPGADPGPLAHLVAASLDIRQQLPGPPLRALTGCLAGRRLLLVLDGCEYVVHAAAALAQALLATGRSVRILATSRTPLRAYGEAVFVVPPLPTPDPADAGPDSASVTLFLARSGLATPDGVPAAGDRDAIAGICRRSEGIPLAIELAAAQCRTLHPQQLLDRLADRFTLAQPGAGRLPDRQRTLRACIDWTHDLCTPERTLWARLSVFAGGIELDGAEEVCTDEVLPSGALLDQLTGLVDKSVVARTDDSATSRYRMLETIRDYGREKLSTAGELDRLRRRHQEWCLRLATSATAEWISDRQGYWLGRLDRERTNIGAAVAYGRNGPPLAGNALRLVVSLPLLYWRLHGLFGQGRWWLGRLVAAAPRTGWTVRGLLLAGHLAFLQGDPAEGSRLLAAAGGSTDPVTRALAALVRGTGLIAGGEPTRAAAELEHGLAALADAGDPDLALRLELLIPLSVAAAVAGDPDRGVGYQQEMLAITEPRGENLYRSRAMWSGGLAAWRRGAFRDAAAQLRASLITKRLLGYPDRYGVGLCLEVLAWTVDDAGEPERAATLLGAADVLWSDLGAPIESLRHLAGFHDRCARRCRAALGAVAFADAVRYGQRLSYAQAIDHAAGTSDPAGVTGDAGGR